MKTLRLALLGQVLFFAMWGGYLLFAHTGGQTIWLETVPVDPRDYLSGHYVALTYRVNSPSTPDCQSLIDAGRSPIYVHFAPAGRTVDTMEGVQTLWDAVGCSESRPSDQEAWGKADLARGRRAWGGVALQYGIERFYVSERSLLRSARSGDVVAKVSVNRAHGLRILGLVKKKLP